LGNKSKKAQVFVKNWIGVNCYKALPGREQSLQVS